MIFLLLAVAAIIWWILDYHANKSCPPGPLRVPIIGNIFQMAATRCDSPAEIFHSLSKKYGTIMSVKMGSTNAIVISDYAMIKELFDHKDMQNRQLLDLVRDRNMQQNLGMLFGNGESAKIMRQFTVRNLKRFGFGKTASLDLVVENEIEEFTDYVKKRTKSTNGIIKFQEICPLPICNIVWYYLTGTRFNYDDQKLLRLLDLHHELVKSANFGFFLALAFPLLRTMFPEISGKNFQRKTLEGIHDFFRDVIKEYKDRSNWTTNPENFIEIFLNQMDSDNLEHGNLYTENQLLILLLDVFGGGSDVMPGIMSFGILYLILNPQVQKKIQIEIDNVISDGGAPTVASKSKMIYTQATLYEILRVANISPILPPRKVKNDVYYKGFLLKKGACVTPNIHSVFQNKTIWGDPETFRPERYIDKNGSLITTLCENVLIVFGGGKRICMGDKIAMDIMFLFLVSILKEMTFQVPPGMALPTTKPVVGLAYSPQPFDVSVSFRK